jgi:hypothetical protein
MLKQLSQLALSALFLLNGTPLFASGNVAVIVNKTAISPSISSRDLRSYILGEKEAWPNGQKVLAILLPTSSAESKVVLNKICNMSEGDFKRYFLQLAFQGKRVSVPRTLASAAAIKAFVAANPGAIGIIRATDADPSVSILSLDGITPQAANYKLASE